MDGRPAGLRMYAPMMGWKGRSAGGSVTAGPAAHGVASAGCVCDLTSLQPSVIAQEGAWCAAAQGASRPQRDVPLRRPGIAVLGHNTLEMRSPSRRLAAPLLLLAVAAAVVPPAAAGPEAANPLTQLSRERVVFQTAHGDIHFGFYTKVRCSDACNMSGWPASATSTARKAMVVTAYALLGCCPPCVDLRVFPMSQAAPKTVEHIKRCAELGLYNTNHIFRVDRGFVAQVEGVENGRTAPMDALQRV